MDKLTALILLSVIVAIVALAFLLRQANDQLGIPHCQEDEIIIGTGDYRAGEGWEDYQCIPADDFQTFAPNATGCDRATIPTYRQYLRHTEQAIGSERSQNVLGWTPACRAPGDKGG